MPADQNQRRIQIALDAMGGDFAPENCVLGAVEAKKLLPGTDILLFGDSAAIEALLQKHSLSFPKEFIVHTSEVVTMEDSPTNAIKSKPDSSIVRGFEAVRDGKADAFVSAGNTGAMMVGATFILGRIPGVQRPTIGAYLPSESGTVTIFDVGTGVDAKPSHLLEYAEMGSIYAEEIWHIKSPRVGLLSNGEERVKGSKAVQEAYPLLEQSGLNFIGNIEGKDILKGKADVVVCDGFIGNIVLKFGESFTGLTKFLVKKFAKKSFMNKLKALFLKSILRDVFSDLDYQNFGGVPLLGTKGITIIGHGSSTPKAVKNMILRANEMAELKLMDKITSAMLKHSKRTNTE